MADGGSSRGLPSPSRVCGLCRTGIPACPSTDGALPSDHPKRAARLGAPVGRLLPESANRLVPHYSGRYGFAAGDGAGARGLLNLVSSTGTLSLISVNFRVEFATGTMDVMRIVNGSFKPSTSR